MLSGWSGPCCLSCVEQIELLLVQLFCDVQVGSAVRRFSLSIFLIWMLNAVLDVKYCWQT